MSLDRDRILYSVLKKLKTILTADVTDPKAGPRPSDAKFILTGYPKRKVYYPHVVLFAVAGDGSLEEGTKFMRVHVLLSIDVLAKSVKWLDSICDDCMEAIRDNWTSLQNWGLKRPELPILFRSNPMTEKSIHRKTAELSGYVFAALT